MNPPAKYRIGDLVLWGGQPAAWVVAGAFYNRGLGWVYELVAGSMSTRDIEEAFMQPASRWSIERAVWWGWGQVDDAVRSWKAHGR